jgi:predicted transcriptional regulator
LARNGALGEMQLTILRVLWGSGEATVAAVHDALRARRPLALTTVATLLTRMEKKGLVAHRSEGRQFVYRAAVAERDVKRSMVADLTRRLFHGDPLALVNHLLREGEVDPAELARLEDMVAKRSRAKGGRRGS